MHNEMKKYVFERILFSSNIKFLDLKVNKIVFFKHDMLENAYFIPVEFPITVYLCGKLIIFLYFHINLAHLISQFLKLISTNLFLLILIG